MKKKPVKTIFFFCLLFSVFSSVSQSNDSAATVKSLIISARVSLKTDTISSVKYLEKAIALSERLKRIDLAAEAYLESADILSNFDSLSKAKKYYFQSAIFFEQSNKIKESCEVYIKAGNLLVDNGKFIEAHKTFKNAFELVAKINNPTLLAEIHLCSGKVYTKEGNLIKAQTDFVQALELFEKTNDSEGISKAWNQIGIIHWKEGKNKEAISAYEKAMNISKQLGDELGLADSYNNLGIIYKIEKKYKKAASYYKKALEIRKRKKNQKGISQTLFNIGSLKAETGLMDEAISYYKRSFEIKVRIRDEYGKLPFYLNMGDAYAYLNKSDTAEYYYFEGLTLSEKLGARDFSQSFHRQLALIFEKENDFKQAYYHQVQYMIKKDSLISISNNEKLAELQTKYDISEKQKNIQSLTQERNLEKEKKEREINFRNSLILIILLILILVIVVIKWGRVLKKNNIKLIAQNELIELREKEKEILLREMHHRVKNNLQLISSLLNLQARKILDTEASQSLKQARDRIHSISLIHQKLYSKENIARINLSDYLLDLGNSIYDSNAGGKKIEIKYHIDDIEMTVDMAISVGLIINETLINSLKHAFENSDSGLIEISAIRNNSKLELLIKDNGKGISDIDNLENFGGFGFQLLKSFTKKLAGEMTVENNSGTIIKIHIPL